MKTTILSAIIGDVLGSVYEFNNIKTTEFDLFNSKCTFTDDTVLTIAVADAIINNKKLDLTLHKYANSCPDAGYGGMFWNWVKSGIDNINNLKPFGSYGNGSAMRVSAVGYAYNTLEEVLKMAKKSAEVTHDHPEGIKGAQAVATAIFLARTGSMKNDIKDYISNYYEYNLDDTIENIRPTYKFNATCQGSVPQAIIAFLESQDYEQAIRLAISIGGDSDTIACIAGGIAGAFYKDIPDEICTFVWNKLPQKFIDIIKEFDNIYFPKCFYDLT